MIRFILAAFLSSISAPPVCAELLANRPSREIDPADQTLAFESQLAQIRVRALSVRAEQLQAAAESQADQIESASKEAGRLGGQALRVKAELGAALKRLRDDQQDGLPVSPSDPFLHSRIQSAIANLFGLANDVSSLQRTVEGLARAVRPDMGLAPAAERLRVEARAIDPEWIPALAGRLADEILRISPTFFMVEARDLEYNAGGFARSHADLSRAADILVLRATPSAGP